jgi:hypothetical protein
MRILQHLMIPPSINFLIEQDNSISTRELLHLKCLAHLCRPLWLDHLQHCHLNLRPMQITRLQPQQHQALHILLISIHLARFSDQIL